MRGISLYVKEVSCIESGSREKLVEGSDNC